jgi:ribosomal protein S27E
MATKEKVAYLKGLMEGMNFDVSGDTGKIIKTIVDILDEMASEVKDICEDIDTLNDYTDEIDHDLGDLEEYVYDGDECDCGCGDDDDDDDDDGDYSEDDDDEEDDKDFIEVICPECGDTVYYDSTMEGKEIKCPNCDKMINPDEKK